MLDVMETATGARRQPVIYIITTFGDSELSPWGDQNQYANQILEGTLVDETFFVFTAHADPEDDWASLETARKANPNFGVSVNPDDLASKIAKAKGIPSAAASYKQKHLNLHGNASAPCLSVDGWKKGQSRMTREAFLASLLGKACYLGVDLASKLDLCAVSALFPPDDDSQKWRVLQRIWTAGETLADRAHRDRAPYQTWVDQGWLTAAPGPSIDHDLVRLAILEWRGLFRIQQIGFDPWHADRPIKDLIADGFDETQVLSVAQTYAGMSAACLRMQAEIISGQMDANGCPVTAWAVSNTVGQSDNKDNLMFIKKRSRGRIDPIISATTALVLALRGAPVERQFQVLIMGGAHG